MIRKTSVAAYKRINDEGLLSKRRLQVYNVLYNMGPLTGNETLQCLVKHYRLNPGNAPSIVSRLGELRHMGVVEEVGKKICSVTGMTVILWDVTSDLPAKYEKPNKIKCETCNGKGYHIEQQGKLL